MNKSLNVVLSFEKQLWKQKNFSAIADYFSPEARIHSPLQETYGIQQCVKIAKSWFEAFPDLDVTWGDHICEGNKIVSRWSSRGTHLGTFKEIPATGKSVTYSGATIYTVENQKIIEYWAFVNTQNIIEQINLHT